MKTIEGTLTAIHDNVIVCNMYFGEQKTKGGLILRNDDGTTRGIYPRWAQVYAKGPENKEDYNVGDWVLIEHGRWTRAIKFDDGNDELEIRRVELESIIGWSKEKPDDVQFGREYANGESATINPSNFVNA